MIFDKRVLFFLRLCIKKYSKLIWPLPSIKKFTSITKQSKTPTILTLLNAPAKKKNPLNKLITNSPKQAVFQAKPIKIRKQKIKVNITTEVQTKWA